MIPAIRRKVGPYFPLLLDGRIRSGEDLAKALVAGANFALIGQPRCLMERLARSNS